MISKKLRLHFASLDGEADVVILGGEIVYHEDNDKEAYNKFCPAREVADSLAKILHLRIIEVRLKLKDVPEDWNFDDIAAAATKKVSR